MMGPSTNRHTWPFTLSGHLWLFMLYQTGRCQSVIHASCLMSGAMSRSLPGKITSASLFSTCFDLSWRTLC